MAEREGFEPSVESNPHTRLAGEHHRPLGHLSTHFSILAEEVGFEPTVLSYNGFQDRRLKPLGHSSEETFLPLALFSVNKMSLSFLSFLYILHFCNKQSINLMSFVTVTKTVSFL